MPRAGFYAVESGKISFRRDGNWYTDEERIDNPRIALLFSRSIRRNPDGSYFLQVGDERASITVDDTPYVVKSVEGDAAGGFTLVLNDDEREPLDASSLIWWLATIPSSTWRRLRSNGSTAAPRPGSGMSCERRGRSRIPGGV